MNLASPSAEDAMLLTVRLWFLWPLVCLLSAILVSPFAAQIQIG